MNSLENDLSHQMAECLNLKRHIVDKTLKPYGFTRTQWLTLAWLRALNFKCSQKQLQQYVDIDNAHMTRVLEQLETKNLLQKVINKEDKRIRDIVMTVCR